MKLAEPLEMLKYLTVMPGNKVADFGAGSGAYTHALLERVGHEGTVFALDGLPAVVDALVRSQRARGRVCRGLVCTLEDSLPLAENLLDAAVVANTLHGIDPFARTKFVNELARVVRPRGEVLVVDWAGSFNNMGPASALMVTPADAVREFRAAGFVTTDMRSAGTHQYAFVATLTG